MKAEIKKELLLQEQKHDIKVLYAVESDSRAWGFDSTDSDWDVFNHQNPIYKHSKILVTL